MYFKISLSRQVHLTFISFKACRKTDFRISKHPNISSVCQFQIIFPTSRNNYPVILHFIINNTVYPRIIQSFPPFQSNPKFIQFFCNIFNSIQVYDLPSRQLQHRLVTFKISIHNILRGVLFLHKTDIQDRCGNSKRQNQRCRIPEHVIDTPHLFLTGRSSNFFPTPLGIKGLINDLLGCNFFLTSDFCQKLLPARRFLQPLFQQQHLLY